MPKTYEQYTINIKNKVIKIAVEEINKTTDIFVKYEYYTEGGRAHVGVIFTFWKKNTETNEISQPKLIEPPEVSSSTLSSTKIIAQALLFLILWAYISLQVRQNQ